MRKKYPTHVNHCTKCVFHDHREFRDKETRECRITREPIYMADDADFSADISNPKYDSYNLDQGYTIKPFPDWCPLEDLI